MIMGLLLVWIALIALQKQIGAQDNVQEVGFQAPDDQGIIFFKKEKEALAGTGKPEAKPENQTPPEWFPHMRCLGCDGYCNSSDDGLDQNGKGNRICLGQTGVLHGCVSIFMYGLRRKCISEMDGEETSYCRKNENLCIECFEIDCNNVTEAPYALQKDGCDPLRTSFPLLLGALLISWLVIGK